MITNLNSMTDFVMQQAERPSIGLIDYTYGLVRKYANFLQQKPTLSMFIACVDGVPANDKKDDLMPASYYIQKIQAQDNVLFAGFEVVERRSDCIIVGNDEVALVFYTSYVIILHRHSIDTLEDLTRYNLPLTPKAQQIIYGK